MIIAVDVDQVVADLHTEWLARYNREANDNVTMKDVVAWDITKFVKKGWGNRMFELLHDASMYDNVKPIPGAIEGVTALRAAGHRVIFASSCVWNTADAKLAWLIKHGFVTMRQKSDTCRDWIIAADKSLVRADVLVDDRDKNITEFPGKGILFNAPWNQHLDWPHRAHNWQWIVDHFAGE